MNKLIKIKGTRSTYRGEFSNVPSRSDCAYVELTPCYDEVEDKFMYLFRYFHHEGECSQCLSEIEIRSQLSEQALQLTDEANKLWAEGWKVLSDEVIRIIDIREK